MNKMYKTRKGSCLLRLQAKQLGNKPPEDHFPAPVSTLAAWVVSLAVQIAFWKQFKLNYLHLDADFK